MLRGVAIAGAIAVLLGCVLCAGSASAQETGCAQAASLDIEATLEQATGAVLCLVNGERALRGLPAVRASRELSRSAQAHSVDMVVRGYFSHVSPGGGSVRDRVLRAGYIRKRQAARVGETIAWGTEMFATPAELVASFMGSPVHRQILLDRTYRDIGIGLVRGAPVTESGDGATLTLDFGRRR